MSSKSGSKDAKRKPGIKLNVKQLKERLEKVTTRLCELLKEKPDIAVYLGDLQEDIKFDLLTSSEDLKALTLEDKLVALEEFDRGKLCSQSFKKLRRRGMEVNLTTIMVR